MICHFICLFVAEAGLRSTSRTPSILQNGEHSPTPSKHSTGSTLSPMASKNAASMRLQSLKQRKCELEIRLNEKNNLLQQLCREEAQLLGCYTQTDAGHMEVDGCGLNTLRRKVDTSFKLSENLLNNGKEDDVHKLLLGKQIQQQISEASLKMANDFSQTKVLNRANAVQIVVVSIFLRFFSFFFCLCLLFCSQFAVPISRILRLPSKSCRTSTKV